MTGPVVLLFIVVLVAGAIAAQVSVHSQLNAMKTRLAILESERERDHQLLEAVLLEDAAKLRRLMGTRE